MKHLIKKNFLQGGGKKKPHMSPPTLRPPQLGAFQILNSYSVGEVIDLISDGPIEGLVNQYGQILGGGRSILQGVYLDNTPVQVSSLSSSYSSKDAMFQSDVSSAMNSFGNIYFSNNNYNYIYPGAPLPALHVTRFISEIGIAISLRGAAFNNIIAAPQWYSPFTSSSGWSGSPYTYFSNTSNKIEFHSIDIGTTAFQADTLLTKLKTDLNSDINTNITSAQKQLAQKALDNLNKLMVDYKPNLYTNRYVNFFGAVIAANAPSLPINDSAIVVISFGNKSSMTKLANGGQSDTYVKYSANGEIDIDFYLEKFQTDFAGKIYKMIVPEVSQSINSSGAIIQSYTGNIYGCIVFALPQKKVITSTRRPDNTPTAAGYLPIRHERYIIDDFVPFSYSGINLLFTKNSQSIVPKATKYNFLNVSCEFKNGEEYQNELQDFKNIYVDYEYGTEMFGPFILDTAVQRIVGNYTLDNSGPKNPLLSVPINDIDGSVDSRGTIGNFSSWNKDNILNEDAIPFIHTIENPNVTSVFFTLAVLSLCDTLEQNYATYQAGDKVPSIVKIQVEWGKDVNGIKTVTGLKKYAIVALVDGQMMIDFGTPELSGLEDQYYGAVRDVSAIPSDGVLPQAKIGDIYKLPAFEVGEDPSIVKRFLRITKLSAETNSVLLKKNISVAKVTEVIENNLSYPLSSIIGIKIDARSFGGMPTRSFDCKLKKVQVPSNYFCTKTDGTDKRYIGASSTSYDGKNLIYMGDWDGTFKLEWTDNPAWIIYDLLTSKRYGLGGYLDESQINKWELYKIGRFCDAVDSNGFFQGVSDGFGGLEPRYSCNILFKEGTKVFDAINMVSSLFRGIVFFSNSEIHFLDDRPRTPISIFTNTNVKDGVFTYTNNRRDQQFNTIEVAYLDRMDNYVSKIEYIQDEADIRKRGIFKTAINTQGVTSRAMARRIGQHLIYQTIKENQSVDFSAGIESLLCRPGDLIIVEDEMKTRQSNYGRILAVDTIAKTLTIDNTYDSGSYTGKITVFTPTGYKTNDDMSAIAQTNRSRLSSFGIISAIAGDTSITGNYSFSGYVAGFPSGNIDGLPEQFPIYTGINSIGQSLYCYYNTGATGFVFSTGRAYANNNTYDKIISSTGLFDIALIQNNDTGAFPSIYQTGYAYDAAKSSKRSISTSGSMYGGFRIDSNSFQGILESEISTVNYPQTTVFNLTGYNNLDYGATIYLDSGDLNINLLPFVSQGSPYRIQRKNASDQIYKIVTIRENSQNEYTVAATKYDTGKFAEIENAITQDFLPNTYYAGSPTVSNANINQLSAPTIATFTTGTTGTNSFSLTGTWSKVTGASNYSIQIYNNIANFYLSSSTTDNLTTGYGVTGLTTLGQWNLKVQSVGNKSTTLDSPYAQTGKFVAYSSSVITPLSKPSITQFTLL